MKYVLFCFGIFFFVISPAYPLSEQTALRVQATSLIVAATALGCTGYFAIQAKKIQAALVKCDHHLRLFESELSNRTVDHGQTEELDKLFFLLKTQQIASRATQTKRNAAGITALIASIIFLYSLKLSASGI